MGGLNIEKPAEGVPIYVRQTIFKGARELTARKLTLSTFLVSAYMGQTYRCPELEIHSFSPNCLHSTKIPSIHSRFFASTSLMSLSVSTSVFDSANFPARIWIPNKVSNSQTYSTPSPPSPSPRVATRSQRHLCERA